MDVIFSKLGAEERTAAFSAFKKYMKPVVDRAFGWDEEFQRSGFHSHLKAEWFYWIYIRDEKVGILCKRQKENSIHIHLLIIFTEAQRKGIATAVTQALISNAGEQKVALTLSCFKNNKPALNLYKKLGFSIKSQDEHFYDFTHECT